MKEDKKLVLNVEGTRPAFSWEVKEEEQIRPDYYKGKDIEVWDIWDEFDLDRYQALIVKYAVRAGEKESYVEDMKKIITYANRAIRNRRK